MAYGDTSVFIRALPYNDVLIFVKGEFAGQATDEMAKWAEGIQKQASATPVAPTPAVQLADIAAGDTGNFGATLPAGIYRVNAYREVTTADPVSGSLGITLSFTHNGKALTRILAGFSGAPQTTSDQRGDVEILEIDPNTTIGYTLTYASNTPGVSRFQVSMIAELLQTLS